LADVLCHTWAEATDRSIQHQDLTSHMAKPLPRVRPVATRDGCCHARPKGASYRRPHRSCRRLKNRPRLPGVAAVGGLRASGSFSCRHSHQWVLHRHLPHRLHCHRPHQAFFFSLSYATPRSHALHGRTCTASHCNSPLGSCGRCRPRTSMNCEALHQLTWLCPPRFWTTPSRAPHQTCARRVRCCCEPEHSAPLELWPRGPLAWPSPCPWHEALLGRLRSVRSAHGRQRCCRPAWM